MLWVKCQFKWCLGKNFLIFQILLMFKTNTTIVWYTILKISQSTSTHWKCLYNLLTMEKNIWEELNKSMPTCYCLLTTAHTCKMSSWRSRSRSCMGVWSSRRCVCDTIQMSSDKKYFGILIKQCYDLQVTCRRTLYSHLFHIVKEVCVIKSAADQPTTLPISYADSNRLSKNFVC